MGNYNMTSSLSFIQILDKVRLNDAGYVQLDVSTLSLTEQDITLLAESITGNTVIGNVYWGKTPKGSRSLIKKIEAKIESNNINYQKYPTDYIHVLLAKHVYQDSKEGDLVKVSLEEGTIIDLSDWKVHKVVSDNEKSGYYGAIYINDITHKVVLAHRGTEIELKKVLT